MSRIRELQQEDIDAVHGECATNGLYGTEYCATHRSRIHDDDAHCYDWHKFRGAVECVIERLEER